MADRWHVCRVCGALVEPWETCHDVKRARGNPAAPFAELVAELAKYPNTRSRQA